MTRQLDATCAQLGVEWVGVVSLVADQAFGLPGGEPLTESFADKGDFMRASRQ